MQTPINTRWEDFFRTRRGTLRSFAHGDEDLVSVGLMSVRERLEKHPNCPDSWLMRRAKFDIMNARIRGGIKEVLAPNTDDRWDKPRYEDRLQYNAMSRCARNPLTVVIDNLQYRAFISDLTEMERKLLVILREEHVLDAKGRYWDGVYAKTQPDRPKPKKRFQHEVSKTGKDYPLTFASLRYKFYLHFGSDDEVKRETQWMETFDPFGRLHANRNGHYNRH